VRASLLVAKAVSPARGFRRPLLRWAALFASLLLVVSAAASAGSATPISSVGPPTATRTWVTKVISPTIARAEPSTTGRHLLTVFPVSAWGAPTELLVLGERVDATGAWLRVLLDYRPNGFAAWIDAEDTILHADPWRISVSRRDREVRVYRAGRLRRTFAAVVGKPSTPTPAGLFAIAAALPQPSPGKNFEGAWVLPLTAHSEVLRSFDGGDGQVALHGRGGASLADPLGSARSHGCVRLANAAIGWIAGHVPVGTPVRIH
jgi:lipoprotein-anchoring transpeptidase ErfK/SrfK